MIVDLCCYIVVFALSPAAGLEHRKLFPRKVGECRGMPGTGRAL